MVLLSQWWAAEEERGLIRKHQKALDFYREGKYHLDFVREVTKAFLRLPTGTDAAYPRSPCQTPVDPLTQRAEKQHLKLTWLVLLMLMC